MTGKEVETIRGVGDAGNDEGRGGGGGGEVQVTGNNSYTGDCWGTAVKIGVDLGDTAPGGVYRLFKQVGNCGEVGKNDS